MRKTLDVSLKTVIFFFIDRYPRSVAKFPSEWMGNIFMCIPILPSYILPCQINRLPLKSSLLKKRFKNITYTHI